MSKVRCVTTLGIRIIAAANGTAQEVWERRNRKIRIDAIYYVVKRLAPAANKPESVSSGAYNAIAREVNACRIEGEKATQMTKADADEYEALFCIPKVRWNQGQSSREELNRLIERWHTLVNGAEPTTRLWLHRRVRESCAVAVLLGLVA